MKTLRLIAALTGLALLVPMAGMAQSLDDLKDMEPQERREYMQSLSPEERQALAEERRAQWDAMTPEEQATARKEMRERRDQNRAAMREHWESLSEEERVMEPKGFFVGRLFGNRTEGSPGIDTVAIAFPAQGIFRTPEGVDTRGNIIWLSDSGNDRIVKYRLEWD